MKEGEVKGKNGSRGGPNVPSVPGWLSPLLTAKDGSPLGYFLICYRRKVGHPPALLSFPTLGAGFSLLSRLTGSATIKTFAMAHFSPCFSLLDRLTGSAPFPFKRKSPFSAFANPLFFCANSVLQTSPAFQSSKPTDWLCNFK